ncbi:hypothetical protein KSP40_PGU008747 [Platanthera guangdongensis]|uniref:Uncharacterized protein n=1 Tax=Platanthera guangdongensis TaxID=2320717 RepID=A0ABR2MSB1_9ASPA
MSAALLLWLTCVTSSGVMLGLLMLGLLNGDFPTKALQNRWIEINNQILNALFTLMSLYQNPVIFHHLFMLCRWRSEDIVHLRKIYCKNRAHRPNEWPHMMVVILLLHITCFAQYALCGVYWGFTSFNRPDALEYLFIALGVVTPVSACVYVIYSPLGMECEFNSNEQLPGSMMSGVARVKLNGQGVLVREPEWIGGLFDCFSDVTVAYLSCCCTCCVFGWNMERLGFGNMYVHIVTFLILFLGPFWIFNISSRKIHDYVIGDVMWISGIVLCVFGLLYGGFWRIQIRKRFRLPEHRFCCGSASLTDYLKWLFCWTCALAQEVRMGNFYNVEDDSLFKRSRVEGEEEEEEEKPLLTSLVESGDGHSDTNLEKPSAAEECNEGSCLMAPCVKLLTMVEDGGR